MKEQKGKETMLSYAERQDRWVKENNVKKGTKVRVCFRVPSYTPLWVMEWPDEADEFVNQILSIVCISDDGLSLDNGTYRFFFPYFCLEVVEEIKKLTVRAKLEPYLDALSECTPYNNKNVMNNVLRLLIDEIDSLKEKNNV